MRAQQADLPEYRVELTDLAEMDVDTVYLGRMRFGPEFADRWYTGFFQAIDKLKTFPNGYALAPESGLYGGEVRQTLYGKGTGAYRLLFRVFEPIGSEPGVVRIMRVYHASRRPLGEQSDE